MIDTSCVHILSLHIFHNNAAIIVYIHLHSFTGVSPRYMPATFWCMCDLEGTTPAATGRLTSMFANHRQLKYP